MTANAPKTVEAWAFVQKMIGDITEIVTADAENERELLEGLGVISRVTALCSELTVEADPELPWFFDMCSPTRLIGGPNPDGRYLLAMIRGDRSYRITGTRGSTVYLGFQVLAGTGMTPRRTRRASCFKAARAETPSRLTTTICCPCGSAATPCPWRGRHRRSSRPRSIRSG